MKKLSVLVALVALISILLCGCGKFTCDGCDEKKSGKKYKEEVYGEDLVLCKDCHEELEEERRKFTCDGCGEEKSGRKYEEVILGEEIVLCRDCHEELEELGDIFG